MKLKFNIEKPKNLYLLFGVFFILLSLPFTVIGVLTQRELRSNAAGTATLYLAPTSNTVNINNTFSVQVRENSGADSVNVVQADLTYDSTKLQFVSYDNIGAAFSQNFVNSTATAGVISIVNGVPAATPTVPVSGDKLVTTLTFKALTTPGAALLAFANTSIIARSSDNTNIWTGTSTGGTFTVVDPAPTVSISAPIAGAVLSGTIAVSVTAVDTDVTPVTKVELYVDGVLKNTVTVAPYNFSLNSTTLTNASHTLLAKAYDVNGNNSTSVTITVDNAAPTGVSISSPAAGAVLKGSVVVNATATDTVGISKVDLLVDGVVKLTDTVTPYNFSWDTTGATNASHNLTVKAYDSATPANATTSTPAVSVTVDNALPTAPTLSFTTPSTTEVDLSWTASTDNNAVTGYDIYRTNTKIASVSGATTVYNDTTVVVGTTYAYYVIAKDAAGNVSPASNIVTATGRKLGDINGDGVIGALDLSVMLSTWGSTTDLRADLNTDRVVGALDLSTLLSRWGT